MGIVRSLQLLTTLVIAVPVALVGVSTILDGRFPLGAVFFGMAAGFVAVSEYVYTRLTDRTVGRLRRLRDVR